MSTPMDTVAGKGRAQSTSLWLWVLVASLLVFAGNTGYALYKTARFGGANTAASNLQVNSQKLANQSREAGNGDAAAFKAVRATKAQIEADVKLLNDRFGSAMDVSGPIGAATATWVPMGKSADQILASENAVLALAGTFTELLTYVVFCGWIFYGLTAATIFVYRKRIPAVERPYNVPGYPWTPFLFIVAAFLLVANTLFNNLRDQPGKTGLALGSIALGLPAYFIWRSRRLTTSSTRLTQEEADLPTPSVPLVQDEN